MSPSIRKYGEWIAVAAILLVLGTCLWSVVRTIEHPDGPLGEPVPSEPPDEANRFHHPSGISIVVPPNWLAHDSPDYLSVYPRGMPARRLKAILTVTKLGTDRPPGLEVLDRTTFQGQAAFERMVIERHSTFDDPPQSVYRLVFQRGNEWFQVQYGVAEARTELPPVMRQYLNTLRISAAAP